MAITYLGSSTDTSFNGGNNVVDLTSLALQEGDVVVATANIASTPSDTRTTDETTGTYTLEGEVSEDGGTAGTKQTLAVYYKRMGATPDSSVTMTYPGGASGNATSSIARAYRGVDPLVQMDASGVSDFGTGPNQPNSPAITTVTDGAFVLSIVSNASQDTTAGSAPTGYGNLDWIALSATHFTTQAAADKEVPSAGVEDPGPFSGFTASAGRVQIRWTIALRPEGAAPPAKEGFPRALFGERKKLSRILRM